MMSGETPQPIHEVSLPPLLPGRAEMLRPLLEAHGASMDVQASGCRVRFPEGTTMQRQLPVVQTTRYEIRFPDGYLLLYYVGRDGKTNVYFDPHDLPPSGEEHFS